MLRTGTLTALLAVLLLASQALAGGEKILRYRATLDAGQQVPPNGSTATGTAIFIINTVQNTLDFEITFSGLTTAESVAHIHGPADVGQNAGVLFPLPLGSPKIGTWNYPESLEADILAGRTYTNIHSQMFPAGEIRGQNVEDCGEGNVNGCVSPQQVLQINADPGAPGCREVTVSTGADITLSLDASLGGPAADAPYVIYAWLCDPQNPVVLSARGSTLGCFANPTPFNAGTPQPFKCLRGGLPALVCGAVSEIGAAPASAPFSLTKPGGLANPLRVTLQGLLRDNCPDPSLGNTTGFSVTNMVVLVVE